MRIAHVSGQEGIDRGTFLRVEFLKCLGFSCQKNIRMLVLGPQSTPQGLGPFGRLEARCLTNSNAIILGFRVKRFLGFLGLGIAVQQSVQVRSRQEKLYATTCIVILPNIVMISSMNNTWIHTFKHTLTTNITIGKWVHANFQEPQILNP